MTTTVTRGPARKPNRRPGAVPPPAQFADYDLRRRADWFAAAFLREKTRTRAWPARTAT